MTTLSDNLTRVFCSALYNYVPVSTGSNTWQLANSVAPPSGEFAFRSIAAGNSSGVYTLFLISEPNLDGRSTSSRLWAYLPVTSTYTLLATSFTANTLWRSVSYAPYDPGTNPTPQPTASFAPTPSTTVNYTPVRHTPIMFEHDVTTP
jgi:hypothetical protein